MKAGDEQERDQHDGGDRDPPGEDLQDRLQEAEDDAGDQKRDAKEIEEHQRVKVLDDVLQEQAAHEAAEQQQADGGHYLEDVHRRSLADSVTRMHGNVGDAKVVYVQPHQQVVGIAIARVDPLEVE